MKWAKNGSAGRENSPSVPNLTPPKKKKKKNNPIYTKQPPPKKTTPTNCLGIHC